MKDLLCHTKEVVFSLENQGDSWWGTGTIRCVFLKDHSAHHLENRLKAAGQERGRVIMKT